MARAEIDAFPQQQAVLEHSWVLEVLALRQQPAGLPFLKPSGLWVTEPFAVVHPLVLPFVLDSKDQTGQGHPGKSFASAVCPKARLKLLRQGLVVVRLDSS